MLCSTKQLVPLSPKSRIKKHREISDLKFHRYSIDLPKRTIEHPTRIGNQNDIELLEKLTRASLAIVPTVNNKSPTSTIPNSRVGTVSMKRRATNSEGYKILSQSIQEPSNVLVQKEYFEDKKRRHFNNQLHSLFPLENINKTVIDNLSNEPLRKTRVHFDQIDFRLKKNYQSPERWLNCENPSGSFFSKIKPRDPSKEIKKRIKELEEISKKKNLKYNRRCVSSFKDYYKNKDSSDDNSSSRAGTPKVANGIKLF